MQQSLEDVLRETEEVIRFLETMLNKELPSSLHAAIQQDWITTGIKGGEEYLEHVPGDIIKEWRKRVISVEKANEILLNFEERMVEKFVQDKTAVATKAYLGAYFSLQFWLSHSGLVAIIIVETLVRFKDQLLSAYIAAEDLILTIIWGKWTDAWDKAKEAAERWAVALGAVVAFALGAIAAISIKPLIVAFGATGFGLAIKPVSILYDGSTGDARKKAFPQGRGRWRRRNPSRRN